MQGTNSVRKGSNPPKPSQITNSKVTPVLQKPHDQAILLSRQDKHYCEAIYSQFRESIFGFLNEYNDTQLLTVYQIFQDPTSKPQLNFNESKDANVADTINRIINSLKIELVKRILKQYENNIYCLSRYNNSELLIILQIFQDAIITEQPSLSEVKSTDIADTNHLVNDLKSELIERMFAQYRKNDDFLSNYNESELVTIYEVLIDEENLNALDINADTINDFKTKAINSLGQTSKKKINPTLKEKKLLVYNELLDLVNNEGHIRLKKLANELDKHFKGSINGSHQVYRDSSGIVATLQADSEGRVKKYQQAQVKKMVLNRIANLYDQKEDSFAAVTPIPVIDHTEKKINIVIPNDKITKEPDEALQADPNKQVKNIALEYTTTDQKEDSFAVVTPIPVIGHKPKEKVDMAISNTERITESDGVEQTNLNKTITKVKKYLTDTNTDRQISYPFIGELEKLDNDPGLNNSLKFLNDFPHNRVKLEYELALELFMELVNITPEIIIDAFITLTSAYPNPKHLYQDIEILLIEKGIKQNDISAACQLMAALEDKVIFMNDSIDDDRKNLATQFINTLISKMFELSRKGNIESLLLLKRMQLNDFYSLTLPKNNIITKKDEIAADVRKLLNEHGNSLHPIVKIQVMQVEYSLYLRKYHRNISSLKACEKDYNKLLKIIDDASQNPQFARVAELHKRSAHHNIGYLYEKMYFINDHNSMEYYRLALQNYSISAKYDPDSCYNMGALYLHYANARHEVYSFKKGLCCLQRGILLRDKTCLEDFFFMITEIKTRFSWIKGKELSSVMRYASKLIAITCSFIQEYKSRRSLGQTV